jgi:hypothetical protein
MVAVGQMHDRLSGLLKSANAPQTFAVDKRNKTL